jgi:conjugative transposon TraK protein
MFRQMKNIDSAFRYIRTFSLFLVAACVLICGYSLFNSNRMVERMQARVYILLNGKLFEAYAAERKEDIEVEVRDHVKTFHQYFFSLAPDEKVIQKNITRALYLCDFSAKKQYDDLKEGGYYINLISGNISQQIEIDSILVNINTNPFYFRCFAKQKITRTTSLLTRSLVTEGYIRTNLKQSDNNPHGFLIERWNIIENRDLKTENR